MARKYYTETIPDVVDNLNTAIDTGLSSEEAKKRLTKYGPNSLASKKKKSMFMRFVDQFKDFMIIVLIIAAILSGVVAHEWTDAAIIMIVVILNAVLGVIQEARSEAAIDALKQMATPSAHVRRDNAIVQIPSTELVPGDIVLLEAGDVVPADLRLISAHSLKIEEAALTGESVPVDKSDETLQGDDIALADRINMAYSSTNVTYGRGEGIVVGTGMNTEVGKIATMLNNADETDTPLKENLNHLGKILTIMILAICVIVFVVGMFTKQGTEPMNALLIDMFLVAASLARLLSAKLCSFFELSILLCLLASSALEIDTDLLQRFLASTFLLDSTCLFFVSWCECNILPAPSNKIRTSTTPTTLTNPLLPFFFLCPLTFLFRLLFFTSFSASDITGSWR